MFLILIGTHATPIHSVDLPTVAHARRLPFALREDAIKITITRDGAIYFRGQKIRPQFLPNQIRNALYGSAERRIYLLADARAKYGDVKAVILQIQYSGVENISILAETPNRSIR